jgi:hypothetical protein
MRVFLLLFLASAIMSAGCSKPPPPPQLSPEQQQAEETRSRLGGLATSDLMQDQEAIQAILNSRYTGADLKGSRGGVLPLKTPIKALKSGGYEVGFEFPVPEGRIILPANATVESYRKKLQTEKLTVVGKVLTALAHRKVKKVFIRYEMSGIYETGHLDMARVESDLARRKLEPGQPVKGEELLPFYVVDGSNWSSAKLFQR